MSIERLTIRFRVAKDVPGIVRPGDGVELDPVSLSGTLGRTLSREEAPLRPYPNGARLCGDSGNHA